MTQAPQTQRQRPSHASNDQNVLRPATILGFLALVTVLLMGTLLIRGISCSSSTESIDRPFVSPYDFSGLRSSETTYGKLEYYEGNALVSRWGVDVSEHQGPINWNAAASDSVEFAVIQLGNRGSTEGSLYLDEQFEANMAGTHEAGIDRSVYFFSQAITPDEAVEEANFVLDTLDGRSVDFIAFDEEDVSISNGRANNLTVEEQTACAEAFCKRIAAAGYTPVIYGNMNDIGHLDLAKLKTYKVWFAEYDVTEPHGQFDFFLWQYSNSGQIDGIETNVDLNLQLSSL